MNTATHRSTINLCIAPVGQKSAALAVDDDIRIAGQRMRHLAPWNVVPLPMMHSPVGTPPDAPRTQKERAISRHLALQVLAVQMCQAENGSALR